MNVQDPNDVARTILRGIILGITPVNVLAQTYRTLGDRFIPALLLVGGGEDLEDIIIDARTNPRKFIDDKCGGDPNLGNPLAIDNIGRCPTPGCDWTFIFRW